MTASNPSKSSSASVPHGWAKVTKPQEVWSGALALTVSFLGYGLKKLVEKFVGLEKG